ncbi:hypothetical protein VCV18_001267 [Metarhizium anisopliae]
MVREDRVERTKIAFVSSIQQVRMRAARGGTTRSVTKKSRHLIRQGPGHGASLATEEDNIRRCYFPAAVISIFNTTHASEDKFAS